MVDGFVENILPGCHFGIGLGHPARAGFAVSEYPTIRASIGFGKPGFDQGAAQVGKSEGRDQLVGAIWPNQPIFQIHTRWDNAANIRDPGGRRFGYLWIANSEAMGEDGDQE